MTLYTIEELREQVLQYLLERHFKMKESGVEFYFHLETGVGSKALIEKNQEIVITFWMNQISDSLLRHLYPRENTDTPIGYWLNLSVNINGEVIFWSPDFLPANLLKRLQEQLKLELIPSQKRWQKNYSKDKLKPFWERIDFFLKHDFGLIQEVLNGSKYFEVETQTDLANFIKSINLLSFESMLTNSLLERNNNALLKRSDNWGAHKTARLLSFEFWNFKGIRHLHINNIATSTKWIFLTGENGFGKTSILQALALGLIGPESLAKNEIGENWLLTTESVDENGAASTNIIYGAQAYKTYTPNKKVAAYGSSRLQIAGNTEPLKLNDQATLHIFDKERLLLNIENELIRAKSYRKDQFGHIIEIIKKIIPDIEAIEIRTTGSYEEVLYYEKDKDGSSYSPVNFNQLAAGFRNLIGFVGDMYLRLNSSQPKPVAPEHLQGIVIIDEIELHLHPKYQKMLPMKLSEIFPNIQFIASTHSPIPLLGAPKESIILTVNRTPETGVTIEKIDIDLSKLLPNAILTSPVFGFEEILPSAIQDSAELETEDSYEASKETQALKAKLKVLKSKMASN